jgi:hypothetical protein
MKDILMADIRKLSPISVILNALSEEKDLQLYLKIKLSKIHRLQKGLFAKSHFNADNMLSNL